MTEEHASAGLPRGPAGAASDSALRTLLRIPVFRRLWLAITVSSLGDWLGLLATTAMAQQLTREESLAVQGAAISGVILTRLLPDLLLAPLAGALADKLDRRVTAVVGDLLALSLYLSIAFTYELTWLYVAQFLVEAVGLFTNPAKQAMQVAIVPRERLAVANQLMQFSIYGAVPIAALLFALLSTLTRAVSDGSGAERSAIVIALVVDALTYGVTASTILLSRDLIPGRPAERSAATNVFSLVAEGISFLRSQPNMRALYIGTVGAFGAGGLIIGVAQLYIATLRAGPAGYGIIFGTVFTGLALGMLVGPRILPTVPRRTLFARAIGLAGLALLVMSLLQDFVLATAAAFLVGLFAGMSWIIGYTLIGLEVEDRLRGRVFSFVVSSVRIVLLLAVAVGPGLAGTLGSHEFHIGDLVFSVTGPGLTLLVGSAIALLVSSYATRQVAPRHRGRSRDLLRLLWGSSDILTASPRSTGLFLVVEGADRALTRRYTDALAEVVRDRGCPVVVTSEPSDTDLGRRVGRMLYPPRPAPGAHEPGWPVPAPRPADDGGDDGGGPRVEAYTAALLAAADRAEHVATVIRPALAAEQVVISAHYVDASMAFHGAGQGLDADRILRTSMWATRNLLPDLTVVVDAPVTEAPADADPDAVRRAFLDRAEAAPDRYVVVPGEQLLLAERAGGTRLVSPAVQARVAALLGLRFPRGTDEPPAGTPDVTVPPVDDSGSAAGARAELARRGGQRGP
ncbi:bifunctional MFS transporter/dTMP kinase [Blastococcus sp. SYSU D00813]